MPRGGRCLGQRLPSARNRQHVADRLSPLLARSGPDAAMWRRDRISLWTTTASAGHLSRLVWWWKHWRLWVWVWNADDADPILADRCRGPVCDDATWCYVSTGAAASSAVYCISSPRRETCQLCQLFKRMAASQSYSRWIIVVYTILI